MSATSCDCESDGSESAVAVSSVVTFESVIPEGASAASSATHTAITTHLLRRPDTTFASTRIIAAQYPGPFTRKARWLTLIRDLH